MQEFQDGMLVDQCKVFRHLHRIIKPNGTIFNGWAPHARFGKRFTEDMLVDCFRSVTDASMQISNERDLYGGVGLEVPGDAIVIRKQAGGLRTDLMALESTFHIKNQK